MGNPLLFPSFKKGDHCLTFFSSLLFWGEIDRRGSPKTKTRVGGLPPSPLRAGKGAGGGEERIDWKKRGKKVYFSHG